MFYLLSQRRYDRRSAALAILSNYASRRSRTRDTVKLTVCVSVCLSVCLFQL